MNNTFCAGQVSFEHQQKLEVFKCYAVSFVEELEMDPISFEAQLLELNRRNLIHFGILT